MSQRSTTVDVKEFAFVNPSGGTGMSNWVRNKQFPNATAKVSLVRMFTDSETGLRFIAESADEALTRYLGEVANATDKRVFFSEFELNTPDAARQIAEQFALAVGAVHTSDGFVFRPGADGLWTDGDITFPSFASMLDECDLNIDITKT